MANSLENFAHHQALYQSLSCTYAYRKVDPILSAKMTAALHSINGHSG